jgi:hypothetical protein
MDVCLSECCVLSGRGLCDWLITRPEESYKVCVCFFLLSVYVCVCVFYWVCVCVLLSVFVCVYVCLCVCVCVCMYVTEGAQVQQYTSKLIRIK